jgi:hypothetical protein
LRGKFQIYHHFAFPCLKTGKNLCFPSFSLKQEHLFRLSKESPLKNVILFGLLKFDLQMRQVFVRASQHQNSDPRKILSFFESFITKAEELDSSSRSRSMNQDRFIDIRPPPLEGAAAVFFFFIFVRLFPEKRDK